MRLLALAVLGSVTSFAHAEAVIEPSTGTKFDELRTVDGKSYLLTGAGVRKKFGMVKVYAMGLYVDQDEARRAFPSLLQRAGGGDHSRLVASDHSQSFLVWGHFGKMAVLHFVRSVDKDKVQNAFRENLAPELSDKSPPDVKKATEEFLALVAVDVKDGQDIVIHSDPEGKLTLDIGGVKKDGPKNIKLARAVWNIWLGPKSISSDLKRNLVARIELLGK